MQLRQLLTGFCFAALAAMANAAGLDATSDVFVILMGESQLVHHFGQRGCALHQRHAPPDGELLRPILQHDHRAAYFYQRRRDAITPDFTGTGSTQSWQDDGSQTGGLPASSRFYRVTVP